MKFHPRSVVLSMISAGLIAGVSFAYASPNLGNVTVFSNLGEKFQAEVSVSKNFDLSCVRLSRDPEGSSGLFEIITGKLGFVENKAGKFIRIVSDSVVSDPAPKFTLQENCGKGLSHRTYNVLLNPASLNGKVGMPSVPMAAVEKEQLKEMSVSFSNYDKKDLINMTTTVSSSDLVLNRDAVFGKSYLVNGYERMYRIGRTIFPNSKENRINLYTELRKLNPELLNTKTNYTGRLRTGDTLVFPTKEQLGLIKVTQPVLEFLPGSMQQKSMTDNVTVSVSKPSMEKIEAPQEKQVIQKSVEKKVIKPVLDESLVVNSVGEIQQMSNTISNLNAEKNQLKIDVQKKIDDLKALNEEQARLKIALQKKIDDMQAQVDALKKALAQ